jgi:hypothetical protein
MSTSWGTVFGVQYYLLNLIMVCHLFAGLAHPIAGLKLTKRLLASYLLARCPPRIQYYCCLKYRLFFMRNPPFFG